MTLLVRHTLIVSIATLIALMFTGCGKSAPDKSADVAPVEGKVTGTVTPTGTSFLLTPMAQGAKQVRFSYGEDVPPAIVAAMGANKDTALVTFLPGVASEDPVAIKVEPAPEYPDGTENVVGVVTEITETAVTLDVDGSSRSLPISPDNGEAFDIPHLEDHSRQRTPIRVFYISEQGSDLALGYEDA